MKCLSVVPGSFPGEELQERNHCLFSGGLSSEWWLLLDDVFHPKLLYKITFYVSFNVSDALRFLHVRSFQFTCQGPVHPTLFFRRATGQGHFWFFPLRCFACFLVGIGRGKCSLE